MPANPVEGLSEWVACQDLSNGRPLRQSYLQSVIELGDWMKAMGLMAGSPVLLLFVALSWANQIVRRLLVTCGLSAKEVEEDELDLHLTLAAHRMLHTWRTTWDWRSITV